MAQSEDRRAGLPDRNAPHLDALRAAAVEARRAEARSWSAMVAHQDAQERRFAADGLTGPALAVARSTVAGDVARVLNCSERFAASTLSTARQVRRDLPDTWCAFRRGLVERIAVTRIAEAAALLTADAGVTDLEVLAAFDAEASAAAARMPLSRLGPWMRRYIARAAPEAADRRARRSRADRWVRVTHDDDGMSLLEARLPTLTAAAIARRLSAVARSADSPVPHQDERGRALDGAQDPADVPETRADGDPRTLDQREADLLGAWLLSGRIDGVEVDAKIAVMIPEATLIGDSQAPGIAADGSFTVPAEDARRLALRGLTGGHDWYEARCRPRTVSGPASDGLGPTGTEVDLLSVVSTGRAPSKRVRDALIF
ncbi:13E12 repeat family protein [Nesterenkonia marinintestina]|uniref:13E12 repeat family protein n=1 Tax=Nesterenkonia marinintestina TaxID=2979865 RepID=UPI0021C18055|nr:13E12 repeat family protein [Nesterenkonia sp. GX14115]